MDLTLIKEQIKFKAHILAFVFMNMVFSLVVIANFYDDIGIRRFADNLNFFMLIPIFALWFLKPDNIKFYYCAYFAVALSLSRFV